MMRWLPTLLLCACTCACTATETGNPSSPVALALTAGSSDDSAVSLVGDESGLNVESVFVSIHSVVLEPCSGSDGASIDSRVIDLLDAEAPSLDFEGTLDEACGLTVILAPPATTHPDVGDSSLVISGTRSDGSPFEVRSDNELTAELVAEPFAPEDLLMVFDLAVWFEMVDVHGAALHNGVAQIDATADPDLLMTFEDRFRLAVELFIDANGNGQLDAEEADPIAVAP